MQPEHAIFPQKPKTPWLIPALGIGSVVGLLLFLYWVWVTLLPIVFVEAKYQYNTFLNDQLHVSSLRQLFIPNFSGLNFASRSKYRDYGIVIPDIFLDERVVFNVDPNNKEAYIAALKEGIAHASSTAFPNTGGLGYYFAHSSSSEFVRQYNAVFYLLGKLEAGDEVYIWHEGEKNEYRVTRTEITKPSEVGFLQQEYTTESIVLQTCWPPGTTRERLLVFAERVEGG